MQCQELPRMKQRNNIAIVNMMLASFYANTTQENLKFNSSLKKYNIISLYVFMPPALTPVNECKAL